ncbi:MAG: indolepyruvate oxidoreductase subunit beta family protein [Hyphomicrobiales bacterium]|nr:indolepyruvate oxidoreductase subunit beta family protein [Hyphomicrobiales bacterium]
MNAEASGRKDVGGAQRISIAILAMGGQGGGVLADWIVALAEAQGWAAQSTSVPGVAQRTGATVYYIETAPMRAGAQPVFALMPTPGDVDVVMASELMEAGRSVLRGLVTPEQTTLIASTHRAFAVAEKETPGDGVGDPAVVSIATEFAAKRLIAFDMEAVAKSEGSVISAAMFGALAATEALPFDRAAFESAIRASGMGVDSSLRAFVVAFNRTRRAAIEPVRRFPEKHFATMPETAGLPELDRLVARIRSAFPQSAQPLLFAGVRRLVDYLDPNYALEYLDRIATLFDLDRSRGGETRSFAFTTAAAKYVAVAMAYDDVMRVADLKIRESRQARVRAEVAAAEDTIVATTEYFHPRANELCGALPKSWGEWIENRPGIFKALDRLVNRGRRIRTNTVTGYLMLAAVASFGRRRRMSLRHAREVAHREAWLTIAAQALESHYELGVEVLACRRLVKGYSDTHARGLSKFDRVMSAVPTLAQRDDGAVWLNRLKRAALADEQGTELEGMLKTVATL